jgi:hypothetical protein
MYIYILLTENTSSSTTPESTHEILSIIYTTSSSFKVTPQGNYQSLIPVVDEEILLRGKYVTC